MYKPIAHQALLHSDAPHEPEGRLQPATAHTLTLPESEHLSLDDHVVSQHVVDLPAAVALQKMNKSSGDLHGASDVEGMRTVQQPASIALEDVLESEAVQVGTSDHESSQQVASASGGVTQVVVVVRVFSKDAHILHGEGSELSRIVAEEVVGDVAVHKVNLVLGRGLNKAQEWLHVGQ